ncbi:hypothetical protein R1sor_026836 [Riccia sorocarpa]|uniref:Uncharacterized protein n=1 Tax=Riccia sorocarpa TaxID=122646 RepID=A0ABD3GCH3_9MARC
MSATVTPAPYERPRGRGSNLVFKSGPLYISSKGLGWKSWKRRWFILTRTSLVFFKNDPNLQATKGGDANLTLGGIDLNSSGSVSLRAEKKLLTVLFPPDSSSPEGRTFTLKAETMEDLEDWKIALDRALAAAPNAELVMNHHGMFNRNDSIDTEGSSKDGGRERRPIKSMVVGRPILLALEDINGSPSFLEKALCFIETYGLTVEGILRQAADVDDVERRVRDYESGKNQFGPDEDAHVVADCVKHVLRELPSSPVNANCCTALLEAHRLEGKESRVASMRITVADTFPEPNRRLLMRVLKMMRAVAAHHSENRMTSSAVAACMAPLLLRPLLAGECGLDDDSDISGDNAAQLLAATTAANNGQSIVTTLLEEFDTIFGDFASLEQASPASPVDALSSDDESTDDEVLTLQDVDPSYHDAPNVLHADVEADEDFERVISGGLSESSGHIDGEMFRGYKVYGGDSDFESPESGLKTGFKGWRSVRTTTSNDRDRSVSSSGHIDNGAAHSSSSLNQHSWESGSPGTSPRPGSAGPPGPGPGSATSLRTKGHGSSATSRGTSAWGLPSSNNKPAGVDMTDSSEEELAIQRLEATRNELRNKIAKEAKGNAVMQASLERRKQALQDRRLALEQDVSRLQAQLQVERDLRKALEMGLTMSAAQISTTPSLDSKTRAELEEIAVVEADVARLKQKVADLHSQLSQQKQQQGGSLSEASERHERMKNLQAQQTQLQKELEQTLALCHQERQKNEEVDAPGGASEDASELEHLVAQQWSALSEAKETLNLERARGQDLRRKPGPSQSNQVPPTSIISQPSQLDPGGDWRTLRPPAGPSAAGRQFAWRQQKPESLNLGDGKGELGVELTNGSGYTSDGGSSSSGKRSNAEAEGASTNSLESHRPPPLASTALAELTTRLDFFKERRSQLMEQLQSLDPTLVPPNLSGHDLIPASPPLTSP